VFDTYLDRHLLGVQFVRSLKSNVYMAVTTYQHTKNIGLASSAADTPALWLNVFLTGTHLLLVVYIKWSDFLFTTTVKVRVFLVSWQQ